MAAALIDFTEVLERRGVDPNRARLLRHDRRGLAAWVAGRDAFGAFASYQKPSPSPYARAALAFQFVPGPVLGDGDHTALFVGAHRILDRFTLDRSRARLPMLHHPSTDREYRERPDAVDAFDLEWLGAWDDLAGRLLIRWGPAASTRSWSQWADRPKEVVEFRRMVDEPGFPGFGAFECTLETLLLLPRTWRAALASVGGVYLLVCPDTGQQYVGSASGHGGFWARWADYAATGHGGNRLLRPRGRRDYAVSILEVASPHLSAQDILGREAAWKRRLGSRAHGLNAN